MTQKLFVRHSTATDAAAVFDFYAHNPHPYVFQRDPEVWKERIASGAVTLIEDAQGKIHAAAIAYPILSQDASGHETHRWTEVGSVRVATADTGLFNPLLSAFVVRSWLLEPPEDRFIMEIASHNTHSKHVFGKLGATPFQPPSELTDQVNKTLTGNRPPVDWFQMGAESVPQLAQQLLSYQGAKVQNKKTGEEHELDFSRCVVMTQFKKAVETLAQQNYGDVKSPDVNRTIKSVRGGLKL